MLFLLHLTARFNMKGVYDKAAVFSEVENKVLHSVRPPLYGGDVSMNFFAQLVRKLNT